MAHSKHDSIRRWYGLCCGYCGVTEVDSGGELTVDHFRPVSRGGDESDHNLVYCCFRCNLNKGDFFPAPDDLMRGHRLLPPLLDNLSVHLREESDRTCLRCARLLDSYARSCSSSAAASCRRV